MNLTERLETMGAADQMRDTLYSFLRRNEEEITKRSGGPSRSFLLYEKAGREREFA